jgi:hypothetical protein
MGILTDVATQGVSQFARKEIEVWAVDNVVEVQIMRISSLFINICNLDGIAKTSLKSLFFGL